MQLPHREKWRMQSYVSFLFELAKQFKTLPAQSFLRYANIIFDSEYFFISFLSDLLSCKQLHSFPRGIFLPPHCCSFCACNASHCCRFTKLSTRSGLASTVLKIGAGCAAAITSPTITALTIFMVSAVRSQLVSVFQFSVSSGSVSSVCFSSMKRVDLASFSWAVSIVTQSLMLIIVVLFYHLYFLL